MPSAEKFDRFNGFRNPRLNLGIKLANQRVQVFDRFVHHYSSLAG